MNSAASGDTRATTAAGTSPPIRRSIALPSPVLSSTAGAPAATSAVRTLFSDSERPSSIATFLPVRSDIDVISGRETRSATSLSAARGEVEAVISPFVSSELLDLSATTSFGSASAFVVPVNCSATVAAAIICSRAVPVPEATVTSVLGSEDGVSARPMLDCSACPALGASASSVLDGFGAGAFDISAWEAVGASVFRTSEVSACLAPGVSVWLLAGGFAWNLLDGSVWRSSGASACLMLKLLARSAFAFDFSDCFGRETAAARAEAMLVSRS